VKRVYRVYPENKVVTVYTAQWVKRVKSASLVYPDYADRQGHRRRLVSLAMSEISVHEVHRGNPAATDLPDAPAWTDCPDYLE